MTTTSVPTRSRFVAGVLIAFGVYSTLLGLLLVAPGAFYDTLGAFGPRNGHYIFDNASFELPLGLLLLAAARWPAWRVPTLAFAALNWACMPSATSSPPVTPMAGWSACSSSSARRLGTILLTVALRNSFVAAKRAP